MPEHGAVNHPRASIRDAAGTAARLRAAVDPARTRPAEADRAGRRRGSGRVTGPTPASSAAPPRRHRDGSPAGSAPSPSRPPWPSTPRPRRSRPAGRPVIGFGAGEPDFPTPDYIVEAAVAACRDPRNHRYTPAGGLPELKEAIAAKTAARLRLRGGSPSQVLVTNGGKQAVYNAFAALLDPGDEVAAARRRTGRPTPRRSGWPAASRSRCFADEDQRLPRHRRPARGGPHPAHQGAAVRARRPTRPARSTRPSRSRRSAAGRSSTASGSSPTRSTSTSPTAAPSSSRCRSLVPELADRCVVLNGVAKTYAMTGWRVGWMIGPPDVVKAATNLQSHATSNVANVSQRAALAAVAGDLSAVDDDARGLRPAPADDRADAQRHPRRRLPGARRARSTPTPRSRACSAGRSRGARRRPRAELAELILDEAEVAIVPGEAFGTPGYVRLSYALGDDDLVEGVVAPAQAARRGALNGTGAHPCPVSRCAARRGSLKP